VNKVDAFGRKPTPKRLGALLQPNKLRPEDLGGPVRGGDPPSRGKFCYGYAKGFEHLPQRPGTREDHVGQVA
jgi:hypothetical protein